MNNNTLEFGVSPEGNGAKQMIADIRKAQQARYDREDKALLDALNQANAYLSAQYNLDEEVK